MKRLIVLVAAAGLAIGAVTPALAHEGGHEGGCEEFGHGNLYWARNASDVAAALEAALGIDLPDDVDSLGDIVSWFAQDTDSWPGVSPGVGDIVELADHLACG